MSELAKAVLEVDWDGTGKNLKRIEVQYNPTTITYDKSSQYAEIPIPGLDAPLQQFVRNKAERLTLELFFDVTDESPKKGMAGGSPTSVTDKTDEISQLMKINPTTHAPPICTFVWAKSPPGTFRAGTEGEPAKKTTGNQGDNGFKCIVENVKQQFTLFSSEGEPLRATLTVALLEYRTLTEQLDKLGLSSPDRTHSHDLKGGETLSGIATRYYRRPAEWRAIAEANKIEDPRRLTPGALLQIPPLR